MGLSRSVEIPLQTSGKGFGGLDTSKRSTQPPAGAGGAPWARCLQQAPPGLRLAQPAALWKPEMVPLLPSPSVQAGQCPLLGAGAQEVQRWTRCDTHSFNCTYTKEGEAVGVTEGGVPGCCC